LFPLLLDFLPVDEVIAFNIRAVSRFFASPKAWIFHLYKLVDIDSLPTWSTETQMHPVVEFKECKVRAYSEVPGPPTERLHRVLLEHLRQASEGCRGFLHWIQFLPRWRLYQPDLVCHFLDVVLDDLDYNGRTYWAMIEFLETFCPWREMRLRLARLMLRIMASATATESTFRAAVKTLDETFPYADRGCLTDVVKIVVSDEKKFTKCLGAVLHMSDFFLIDDPERLASVRRLLLRVYKRPESLQETKRELLNLLTR